MRSAGCGVAGPWWSFSVIGKRGEKCSNWVSERNATPTPTLNLMSVDQTDPFSLSFFLSLFRSLFPFLLSFPLFHPSPLSLLPSHTSRPTLYLLLSSSITGNTYYFIYLLRFLIVIYFISFCSLMSFSLLGSRFPHSLTPNLASSA